jgi:hypothetical protein
MRKTILSLIVCCSLVFGLASILSDDDGVFNVTDYGAIAGDGQPDDEAFMKANLDAVPQSGAVYVPPAGMGRCYDFMQPFVPSAGVKVLGAGPQASVLRAVNPDWPMFGGIINIQDAPGVVVEGLGFVTAVPARAAAVNMQGSPDSIMRDCWVGPDFLWVAFIGNTGNPSDRSKVLNVRCEGSTIFEMIAIVDSSDCEIEGCYLKPTTHVNVIELFLSTPGMMRGNKIINNILVGGAQGVHCVGGTGTIVEGNNFADQLIAAILVDVRVIDGQSYPSTAGIAADNFIDGGCAQGAPIYTQPGTLSWNINGNSILAPLAIGMILQGTGHSVNGGTVLNAASISCVIAGDYNSVKGLTLINGTRGCSVVGDDNTISIVATDTRTPKRQDYGLMFEATASGNRYGLNSLAGNAVGTVLDLGMGNIRD